MLQPRTRRQFLGTAAGSAALGLPDLSGLLPFSPVRADEPKAPEIVRFGADLEPLVRLIEETPRDKCVAVFIERLRDGLPYRRFLAAVFLAAVRKRDSHHSTYLVHSAHQLSLDMRPEEMLLPIFWAIDHYKWQQEKFPTPGMEPITGNLPSPEKAVAEFHTAMQRFDGERAERALVAVCRTDGAKQAADQLWPYACRDLGFIGHRAISVTSSWRALEAIGWQDAEPVLRFVIRDLYLRGASADKYHRANSPRVDQALDKIPPGWATGKADRGATLELFALIRQAQGDKAGELALKQLTAGVGAQAIWDAAFIGAAELFMLHTSASGMGNRPLHINTAVNALHYAFNASTSKRTRVLSLLQALGWAADFIQVDLQNKNLDVAKPLDLEGAKIPTDANDAITDIFASLPPRTYVSGSGHVMPKREERAGIGQKVFALTSKHPEATSLYMKAARSWLCVKTSVEAHEFKLPAALFENVEAASPEWRSRLLAASAHWLHGKQSPDSELLKQAREAVKRL